MHLETEFASDKKARTQKKSNVKRFDSILKLKAYILEQEANSENTKYVDINMIYGNIKKNKSNSVEGNPEIPQ